MEYKEYCNQLIGKVYMHLFVKKKYRGTTKLPRKLKKRIRRQLEDGVLFRSEVNNYSRIPFIDPIK